MSFLKEKLSSLEGVENKFSLFSDSFDDLEHRTICVLIEFSCSTPEIATTVFSFASGVNHCSRGYSSRLYGLMGLSFLASTSVDKFSQLSLSFFHDSFDEVEAFSFFKTNLLFLL